MLFALTSLYTGGPKSAPEKDLGPHASYVSQARSADPDPDLLRAVTCVVTAQDGEGDTATTDSMPIVVDMATPSQPESESVGQTLPLSRLT